MCTFINNKTVNKASRFFSFSKIMLIHSECWSSWIPSSFPCVSVKKKFRMARFLAKKFVLALIISLSSATGTSPKVWFVTELMHDSL